MQLFQDEQPAGDLWLAREDSEVLAPLFNMNPADDASDSRGPALLWHSAQSGGTPEFFPGQYELEPAQSGAGFTGKFQLQSASTGSGDSANAGASVCTLQLEALHATEFPTIARHTSRLAAIRGSMECPGRSYRLRGLMRVWPEGSE